MLFKTPERRRFDYQPFYYKPEADPEVKRRQRIHFPKSSKARNPFTKLVIMLIVLLAAILYSLKYLALDL